MLITEVSAKEQNGTKKTVAVTVALVLNVVLILVLLLVTILVPNVKEPELVAKVVSVSADNKPTMQKKSVMKQVKQASSASAASPIAKMLRANTTAQIVAPKVTQVTSGPLGLGEGEFGEGFGAGSGNGMGSGATMFGSAGGSGLVGRLFDMKQNSDKRPKAYDPSVDGFYSPIRRLISRKFPDQMLDDYYQAKVQLGFTFLAIPNMDANEGPKAFQADKEIQPRGWFVHYAGRLSAPESGEYRFHGMFDDLLIVIVDGNPVLDASWDDCLKDSNIRQTSSQPSFMSGKPVLQGKWVNLRSGSNVVILVGERPGGRLGGTLMIEKKGGKYEKRGNGAPLLPLFSTVKIGSKEMDLIKATGYQYGKNAPVFRASR